jgi:hypothetical protein
MSKVISAHAIPVDGYITSRDPGAGHGLGDETALFDWYSHLAPGVTHLHCKVVR